MEVIELSEDNLELYADIVGPDGAENIGREFYRGFVLSSTGEKADCAAVWELLHLEDDDKDTEARIEALYASSDKAGEELIDRCSYLFEEDGVCRSFFELPAGDEHLPVDLLERSGYEINKGEGRVIVTTLGDLLKLPFAKRKKVPSYVRELGSLMVRPFRRGVMDCIYRSKRALMEDLGTIPMSWFEQQVSSYVETDDRVSGFLLVHMCASGRLKVEVFTSTESTARWDLLNMMTFSVKQAASIYPEDTEVVICRRDDDVMKLIDYLLPGVNGKDVYYGNRNEERKD